MPDLLGNPGISERRDIIAVHSSSDAITPTVGLVTGILYNEDNPSAIIGSWVVYEGEALHGVNIVKIHKDKVEFEKNGNEWTQVIQQKPAAFWK